MKYNLAPILIIGMHRSGTSMISRKLESLGLFLGNEKDENHEAYFFRNINEWLLNQVNCHWNNPENFKYADKLFKNQMTPILKWYLSSEKNKTYFKKGSNINFNEIDFLWGWKDPRNTFTIEIWKDIFPEMKVIHIYRNPIDVAQSLKCREDKIRKSKKINLRVFDKLKLKFKDNLFYNKNFYNSTIEFKNINEGINLWKIYTEKAFLLSKTFKENILHIKYEDVLDNPQKHISELINFLNLDVSHYNFQKACEDFDKSRKYAFLCDKLLVDIYEKVKNDKFIKEVGYSNINV